MMGENDEDGDVQAVFSTVFGSDSESDGAHHLTSPFSSPVHNTNESEEEGLQNWQRVDEIRGLWLCKNFLSEGQQKYTLDAIFAEGWFDDKERDQAMRFGELPHWALELSECIEKSICSCFDLSSDSNSCGLPLSPPILSRKPLFDQMILNCYQPGQGIAAHVDLARFEDGIAIFSFESPCVMHFAPVRKSMEDNVAAKDHGYRKSAEIVDNGTNGTFTHKEKIMREEEEKKVPVLLMPGDLVLMSGEARYKWTHEINRSESCQVWNSQRIAQERRISVTLRRLCPSI